jgi:NADPH-dependent glutamate synthase beta subunit-like oxidoreductase
VGCQASLTVILNSNTLINNQQALYIKQLAPSAVYKPCSGTKRLLHFPAFSKMNIGIIGAGAIGGTLAGQLTKLGHTVYLANSRGPETLTDLATKTGAKAVTAR